MYAETDKDFYFLAGDCRIIFEHHQELARARSSSRSSAAAVSKAKVYVMDAKEMETLKKRVYSIRRDVV